MKTLFLNGSPKNADSASELIINALSQRLSVSENIYLNAKKTNKQEFLEKIKEIDTLVIVFPLYVDGLPSHLLRLLFDVKNDIKLFNPNLTVCAIANNGFYEGRQNCIALSMIRNFCISADAKWGQGLGIGAGGMLSSAPIGAGPLKNIGLALDKFSDNLINGIADEDIFVEPNFPKFLYKILAHMNFKGNAKKNGLRKKELYAQKQHTL